MYLRFKDENDNPVAVNFNLVEMWGITRLPDGSLGIEIQFSSGKFQTVKSCMNDIERALRWHHCSRRFAKVNTV
jgi:hypothetical protein